MLLDRLGLVLLSLVLLTAVGCAPKKDTGTKVALRHFAVQYMEFYVERKRSPASVQEMSDFEPAFNNPTGDVAVMVNSIYDRINSGEIVVVWKATLTSDSDKNDKYLLAYEATVPEKGGFVLTGSGRVAELTAEEFAGMSKISAGRK